MSQKPNRVNEEAEQRRYLSIIQLIFYLVFLKLKVYLQFDILKIIQNIPRMNIKESY